MFDVVIIGCGVVGAAAAYELSRYDLKVAVLERENDVATGATKANSAVIHAGYDPFSGTLMAKLNVEGSRLAGGICEKLDVPFRRCGSLVLAFSGEETRELERLLKRGIKNGVPGVEIIAQPEVRRLEPNLSGGVVAALYAPSAMIVDPWEYTLAFAETAVRNGAELRLECDVTGIGETGGYYRLQTTKGPVESRTVLNAAGLYADVIHNMVAAPSFTILPGKGEYCLMDKSEGALVSRVIFQCPGAAGKGVLVAPTVHGNLSLGPGSVAADGPDDAATTAGGLEYVMDSARKSVPGIDPRAVIRNFSGNRARSDRKDFIIEEARPGFIDLAGIKSPGLSAAPAIAKMAARMLEGGGLMLTEKRGFVDSRKRVRFKALAHGERAELVGRDPAYGRVVCRCETVTEGEIRDALAAPVPPRSIDAVKRRCGAGMGRCQGGFCGPHVLDMLAKHYGCDPTQVSQDTAGAFVLLSETKRGGAAGESKDNMPPGPGRQA